jgi:hypothetical protein
MDLSFPRRRWTDTLTGRRRAAAVLAAALLSAGPGLAAGAAHAAPGSGPSVEFTGGSVLNMLVCKSQPSTRLLTVAAEAKVTFVNRLGQPATLRINGRVVTQVPANLAVPVAFHQGRVAVSMAIACNVGVVEQFESVTVVVTPPAPVAAGAAGVPATGSGATVAGSSGRQAATPGRAPAADAPANPADAAAADPWAASVATDAANPTPAIGGAPPELAGPQPAEVGDIMPASGEPVHRPSGLLAMIATVLTVGVGVAALRSVGARRTTRACLA